MTYKRLKEMDLSGKSVLLRLDLNAPIQDGTKVFAYPRLHS